MPSVTFFRPLWVAIAVAAFVAASSLPARAQSVDSDGDGVADIVDFDDDNDGVPDTVECPEPYTVYAFVRSGDPAFCPNLPVVISGRTTVTAIYNQAVAGSDFTYDGKSWTRLATGVFPDASGRISVSFRPDANSGGSYAIADAVLISNGNNTYVLDNQTPNSTEFALQGPWTTQSVGVSYFGDEAYVLKASYAGSSATWNFINLAPIDTACDSDGDGIPNRLDPDSDGDGFGDAYEAGASTDTSPTFAFPANAVNSNGVPTAVQPTPAGNTVNYDSTYTLFALNPNENPDNDGDGIPNPLDLDDDNDGVPDANEVSSDCYAWSTPPSLSGNVFRASANGVGYSYSSTSSLQTTANVYSHSTFPAFFGLPNTTTIQNLSANTNTVTFDTPVNDPILAFASIGAPSVTTSVTFATPIDILFSESVVQTSPTTILGTEGYAIVRLPGRFKSFSFAYANTEAWCNFVIGLNCRADIDTDGDGIPNRLDLDSDSDGCGDSFEAGASTNRSATNTVGAPYGTNGLANSVETTADSATINYSSTYSLMALTPQRSECTDTDGDGTPDYRDIDAENDGVPNANEAPSCFFTINEWNTTNKSSMVTVSSDLALGNGLRNFAAVTDGLAAATNGGISFATNQTGSNKSYLTFTFVNPVQLDALYLAKTNATQISPTNLILQGANSLTNWVDLAPATNVANAATVTTSNGAVTITNGNRYSVTTNAAAYRYYRLFSTNTNAPTAGTLTEVYFDVNASSYVPSLFAKTNCATDTDNDGSVNYLDPDSDGDGCSDAFESGATTNPAISVIPGGYGSNGLADSLETTNDSSTINYLSNYDILATIGARSACTDTDGDGFPDFRDADADNDGVVNSTEAPSCFFSANEWNTTNKSDMVAVSSDLTTAGGFNNFAALDDGVGGTNGAVQFATNQSTLNKSYLTFNFLNPVRLDSLVLAKTNATQISPTNLILQGANSPTNWVNLMAAGTNVANATSVTMSNGSVVVSNANRYVVTTNAAAYRYYRLFSTNTNAPTAGTLSEIYYDVNTNSYVPSLFAKTNCATDTDNDGSVNYLDLDSDGDGSGDAFESGASTNKSPTYAFPTNSVNSNGVPSAVQTNANSDTVNYDSTYNKYALDSKENLRTDTDSDGIPDAIDVDDDNDGIPDNVECLCISDLPTNQLTTPTRIYTVPTDEFGKSTFSKEIYARDGSGLSAVPTTVASLSGITHSSPTLITTAAYVSDGSGIEEDWVFELGTTTDLTGIVLWTPGSNGYGGGDAPFKKVRVSWTDCDGGTKSQIFDLGIPSPAAKIVYFDEPITGVSSVRLDILEVWYDEEMDQGVSDGWEIATPTTIPSAFNVTLGEIRFINMYSAISISNCSKDTDGDGIPNRIDLDSDGDGCSDAYEGGSSTSPSVSVISGSTGSNGLPDSVETTAGSGIVNYSSTYRFLAVSPAHAFCDDSDGDGVLDNDDLDDDNDGVTDCQEGFSGALDLTGIGTAFTNRVVDVSDGFVTFSGKQNVTGGEHLPAVGDTAGNLGMSTKAGAGNAAETQLTFNRPTDLVVRNQVGPTGGGFLTGDEYEIFTSDGLGMTLSDPANELEIWNGSAWIAVPANYKANTIQWRLKGATGGMPIGTGSYVFNVLAATSFKWRQVNIGGAANGVTINVQAKCVDTDADGDGIPNRLDTDSDGDSCPDSFETGTSTNSFTNTVAGPYGTNGWADNLETNVATALTNISFTITTNNIALATDGGTTATTNGLGGSMNGNIMAGTNVAGQWFLTNFRYTRKAIGATRVLTGTNFTAANANNPYGVPGVAVDMNMGGGESDGIMKFSYQVRVAMNPGYRADQLQFLGNGVITARQYGSVNATNGIGGSIRLNGFSGTGTAIDPDDRLVVSNNQSFTPGQDLRGYRGEFTAAQTRWYFATPASLQVSYSVDVTGYSSLASELTAFSVRVVADNYSSKAENPAVSDCSFPSISITSVTVNEASPYAMVRASLSAATGAPVTFTPSLSNGTGFVGADTGTAIEYYNGSAWVSAATGVTIPTGQTSVLLRTAVKQDADYEVSETVSISTGPLSGPATPAQGVTGTITIVDNGTGSLFDGSNTNGTPNAPGSLPGLPSQLDNDANATPPNADSDGVPDNTDIDDDNDGVTDCEEGFTGPLDLTGAGTGFSNRAVDPDGYTLFSGTRVGGAGEYSAPSGDNAGNLGMATKAGVGNQTSYRLTFSRPINFVVRNQQGPSGSGFVTSDEYEIFSANGAQIALSDPANELEIWNGTAYVSVPANYTSTTPVRWRFRSGSLALGTGSFIFTVTGASSFEWTQVNQSAAAANGVTLNFRAQCADTDTDGDGTPNRLDTNSDDDTCPDAYEAGKTTNSVDTVPGPYGTNGYSTQLATNVPTALSNITFTISTNNFALATAGATNSTTNVFGGSMNGKIMQGTNEVGQWFVSNFRYTRLAPGTNNNLVAATFSATNTNNPYGVDGIGMQVGLDTVGGMRRFSYQVSVSMNPGYSADRIYLLGKDPNSGFFYGPSVGTNGTMTNNGGSIRVNWFTGSILGTVVDPDDNLFATNGQTFSAGSDLLGYKGAEKTPAQNTWYLSVPADNPVVHTVDFSNQSVSANSEATAFSVRVVTNSYTSQAINTNKSTCPPFAPTISIGDVTVNEVSPFAVVKVTLSAASASAVTFTPSLANGTGTAGTDTGTAIEYYNGTAWVSAASGVTIPAGQTSVLLRTAVTQDTDTEISETVLISTGTVTGASNTAGVTGTITIKDDGSGDLFSDNNTSGTPDAPGSQPDLPDRPDDDRPLSVNNISVNEGSPYGVFTVSGAPGQLVSLALASGTATIGTDTEDAGTGVPLQYFNGTAWVDYTPGSFVALGTDGKLLVRTKITDDDDQEGAHDFTLTATNTGGTSATGTCTILDDGTGNIYPDNTTGNPDQNAPKDDDRTLQINDVTTNEVSPYAVFRVTNPGGTAVDLSALAISYPTTGAVAALGANPTIEVFNGTSWVPFAANLQLAAGAQLLVRVGTTAEVEPLYEGPEKYLLGAAIAGGGTFFGTGTILDDGTGDVFPDSPSGNPDENAPKADDRELKVNNVTTNEGSPYAVFTVNGTGTQGVKLALQNDTDPLTADAVLGTDTGNAGTGVPLQYFNGTSWVDYTPGSTVNLIDGKLLVRTAITDDDPFEGPEKYLLAVSNLSNNTFYGIGTILDDGTGDVYPDNTTGNPDQNAPKDDDRQLQINDVTVNEASPYSVFRVKNPGTSDIDLASLKVIDPNTGAIAELGPNPPIQVFNGTSWVPFAEGMMVPAGSELLVRVGITNEQETLYEGPEKFLLAAGITNGPTFYGTGTILDDGKGDIYPDNTTGNPDENAPKDDDRTLQVNDVTINEGSPFAVFRVTNPSASPIDLASLSVIDPNTGVIAELGPNPPIQVWDGAAWVALTPGLQIPANGELLVRVGTTGEVDGVYEGPEKFVLVATSTGGTTAYGIGTILDDGTGDIYPDDGSGNPDQNAPKDDDRQLQVNDVTVNEASPFAVFKVKNPGTVPIDLGSLQVIDPNTGAIANLGANPSIEVYDPSANGGTGGWVALTPGLSIAGGGELLVRVGITNEQEALFEGPEKFLLAAGVSNGPTFYGTGTILDDGKGDIYPDNNTGNPDQNAPKDDDRTLQINDVTTNEDSPFAMFRVTNPGGTAVDLSALAISYPSSGAIANLGPTPSIEVWDGAAWVTLTPGLQIPGNGELLVRVGTANEQEDLYEGPEKYLLGATLTGGGTFYGTGTILDDGNGDLYSGNNNTGTPDLPGSEPDLPAKLDDDRQLQIGNVTVNENSPFAMFRVANPGLVPIDLGSLKVIDPNTGAIADLGASPSIEVWNGSSWVPFAAGMDVPANGELLVRVGIGNEKNSPFEGPEKFLLAAGITSGPTFYGTGTILDDGSGDLFSENNNTGTPDAPGSEPDLPDQLKDDRPLSVNDVTVNEGSPYTMFTVGGAPGQLVSLALASGTATLGTDTEDAGTGVPMQYYNGSSWVDYTANSFVAVPAGGQLLVRTKITDDTTPDNGETFTLTATNTGNLSATGTCTIADDGTGNLYSGDNNTGTPDALGSEPDLPAQLDDERPLSVNDISVNEGSPYGVFSVTGKEGQQVKLDLAAGTATAGTDYDDALEYFDGTNWVPYTPGSFVSIPSDGDATAGETAKLLVRFAVKPDNTFEGDETLTLKATNTAGAEDTGTATIADDGTGDLYSGSNNTGTPEAPGTNGLPATPDNDTPSFSIDDVVYNEAAGTMTFTVTLSNPSAFTATVDYATSDGTATAGADYTATSGTLTFAPGETVKTITVPILDDLIYEVSETMKVTLSNPTNATIADDTGIGTIKDDGTGLGGTNDDRRNTPSVGDVTVNEGSPYALFTVQGVPGANVDLSLASGTATLNTDFSGLEWFNGTDWVNYGSGPAVIGADGKLLVRTKITNDGDPDNGETFTLSGTYTNNAANVALNVNTDPATATDTGTGTIKDDGSGDLFSENNETDTPDAPGSEPDLPAELDDDRPLSVSSPTVNEASPYAVFGVTGQPGQKVSLDLANTSDPNDKDATLGTDAGPGLEYFDGANWVPYTPGDFVTIPPGGKLLVRTPITNDGDPDNNETFGLVATNTGGTPAEGTATVKDDGSGDLFSENNNTDTPNAPGSEPDLPDELDDDRPLSVSSPTVNEASPYAVFGVTGEPGQKVSLALANTSDPNDKDATLGTDAGNALEYFDGANWVAYTPGDLVTIPPGGKLLVRTPVTNDGDPDNDETFNLVATNTGGTPAEGTATIKDDGSGDLFSENNNTDTPDAPGSEPDLPDELDDDRPLSVSSPTVNEASPYAVFGVTGQPGQKVSLALANTSDPNDKDATLGTDAGPGLEYFDGTDWVAYTPGDLVTIPPGGKLLVRTPVTNDGDPDNDETFNLVATSPGGTPAEGTATIKDDGSGDLFSENNNTDTPDAPGSEPDLPDELNDDRPLSVNDPTVNEGSPYAVFGVTGEPGQKVSLALANTSDPNDKDATLGTDAGNALEYFDGANWVAYTPGDLVTIPAGGKLLVRTPITNDGDLDNNETFNLVATSPGGTPAEGTATIKDDGSGDLFSDNNTTGTPDAPGSEPDLPDELNDDRPLSVTSPTVNEGSPYAVFGVTGAPGQKVSLDLANTSDPNDKDATLGTDAGPGLEYFDGANWVPYTPGDLVTIPPGGKLLVRTPITNDGDPDNNETFNLVATNTGGTPAEGTATIKDDGSGDLFSENNNTDTPDAPGSEPDLPDVLDDDRPLSVSSPTVNEASPYAVFGVTGAPGQKVSLALANTSDPSDKDATLGTDAGPGLEYFDGANWVAYNPGDLVTIPPGGKLLVRTPVTNDGDPDNDETFNLVATNTGGTPAEGTATIKDDGTGSLFSGSNNTGTPELPGQNGLPAQLNDDRPLSVTSPTVNEGSPYAMFGVTGAPGQKVSLALANTSDPNDKDATLGTDAGPGLEYFNGTDWVAYTPGDLVTIPAGGKLLVRTPITNDGDPDNNETFNLVATNTGGTPAEGTATIKDDGSGDLFGPANTSGTPDTPGTNGLPAQLNDDRPLSVNDISVNEGSPYGVFKVTGAPGQLVSLALGNTSDPNDKDATLGTDTGNAGTGVPMQYFNGTNWLDYTPGSFVAVPAGGELLVRTKITNDTTLEGAETFTLIATNTGGTPATGKATVNDDGTGSLFSGSNNSGTPDAPSSKPDLPARLDDDRPLSVNDISVNEGSPYGVFTVTGQPGQLVSLALGNTSDPNDKDATLGTDTGTALEYFNGTNWLPYTPGDFVAIPAGGKLLVRTPINNDNPAVLENAETFTLIATNTGGTPATGKATITDNGTGGIFLAANTTGTPDDPAAPGYTGPVLDDDRALSVNSMTVNEGSPYTVFTVTGAANQLAKLALAEGTATASDFGPGLEWFDGVSWVAYVPNSFVPLDGTGKLLVRTAITPDNEYEVSQSFKLVASNTGGTPAEGTCTITDNGTGSLFGPNNTTGTPDLPGQNGLPANTILDDDRRPFASSDFIEPLPDRPIKFLPSILLGNDTGDGRALRTGTFPTSLGGTVTITSRAVTYTPPPGGLAPTDIDSFNYTVFNAYGEDIGTVNLVAEERALTLPIKIISAEPMQGGGKMVRLCALPMMQYEVFATSDLATSNGSVLPEDGIGAGWELVGVYTAKERGDIYVDDVNAGSQRFYRLRIRP